MTTRLPVHITDPVSLSPVPLTTNFPDVRADTGAGPVARTVLLARFGLPR
jgi:hypothetical protein